MFDNLMFDLDGTLTDPRIGVTKSIQHALSRMNRPVPEAEALLWCIGPPLQDSFKELLHSQDEDLIEHAISFFRERYSDIGMYENYVYPGVEDLLEKLWQDDRKIFVVTSKLTKYARKILSYFNLNDYFDNIYGAEISDGIPDKGILVSNVLRAEHLKQKDTAMIGDRKFDVLAAKRNCVAAVGVSYGYGSELELTEAGVDYLFFSPADLQQFLLTGSER